MAIESSVLETNGGSSAAAPVVHHNRFMAGNSFRKSKYSIHIYIYMYIHIVRIKANIPDIPLSVPRGECSFWSLLAPVAGQHRLRCRLPVRLACLTV